MLNRTQETPRSASPIYVAKNKDPGTHSRLQLPDLCCCCCCFVNFFLPSVVPCLLGRLSPHFPRTALSVLLLAPSAPEAYFFMPRKFRLFFSLCSFPSPPPLPPWP